jgi:hypothetical protein
MTMIDGYLIFLHQVVNAADGLADDGVFAGFHFLPVEGRGAYFNAVFGKVLSGFVIFFGGVEEGFGGDTADIEAGAAKGGIAFHESYGKP